MDPEGASGPWPIGDRPGSEQSIQSDETLFAIVECLHSMHEAGVTEIADRVGVSKSTVHKHLTAMRRFGYVAANDGTYRLGLQFLHFGLGVRTRHGLYDACKPVVEQLARTTGEAAWCLTHENGLGLFLHGAVETSPTLVLDPNALIGTWKYLHTNAPGKAILAYLPEEELEWVIETWGLPPRTPDTLTEPDELYDDLKQTREEGYSLNLSEHAEGTRAVGAPVLVEGLPIGAISVSGAANRLTLERCESELAPEVRAAADDVEINYLFRGDMEEQ